MIAWYMIYIIIKLILQKRLLVSRDHSIIKNLLCKKDARSCIETMRYISIASKVRQSFFDKVVPPRDLYRTHFIIYTDIFRVFAIPSGSHRSFQCPVHEISHILHPQADVFVSLHLL